MTIIAGFQCTDGILMCSDTEQSFSATSKSQVKKIPHFTFGKLNAAIGGAGDGALVEYVTQDLAKHLAVGSFDWTTIELFLNDYARRTFTKHIRPYTGSKDEPEVSFLIAIVMNGKSGLFKWERNFAYLVPVPKHTSIGIGIIQSEELLNEIHFFFPSEFMIFFAVRMMQQVKRLVPGCGGKTEISFLPVDGTFVMRQGVFVTDDLEHLTDMVDEFVTNHVLTFISDTRELSKDAVDNIFQDFREAILNLRKKYGGLKPGVRILKPAKK